jgi:hypothetical protein
MKTFNYILRKWTQCKTKNNLIGHKKHHSFATVLVSFVAAAAAAAAATDKVKSCIRYAVTYGQLL